ncbi:hypothetical protein BRL77_18495 [Xanthomonas oryzae pv. oryzae]|nr:hypothetical protein BRL77_18495 [Xanthomonas oryzae pv. oryzae]
MKPPPHSPVSPLHSQCRCLILLPVASSKVKSIRILQPFPHSIQRPLVCLTSPNASLYLNVDDST